MKKTATILFLSTALLAQAGGVVSAQDHKGQGDSVPIFFDGKLFADIPVKNGRSFIPLRAFANEMSKQEAPTIEWDAATNTANVKWNGKRVSFQAGNFSAIVDGQAVQLVEAPFISSDEKMYIPAVTLSTFFGNAVEWDENRGAVNVNSTNAEKAVAVLEALESGDPAALQAFVAAGYIQHNLTLPTGRDVIIGALPSLKAAGTTVVPRRILVDGNYVAVHSEYNFGGPKAGFDIFRFENGKIVEHWDNLQALAEPNPSGHTMLDGTTQIADLDKTEQNKALVKGFVENVLMGKNPNLLTSYFDGDNYIQHNPSIADGLSGLGSALKAMADQGIEMKYDTIHQVIGQGNFVLVVSEGSFAGKHTSYYDLFRVENSKIAEHWDVMETILPEDQQANKNGKFNFMEVSNMTNIQNEQAKKAAAVLESLESGKPEAIQQYINSDKYIQHNLGFPNGRDAMLGALDQLKQAGTKVDIKRIIVDGDFVVLHTDYNFFGPKIGFDIFRFENDQIVEHWDNLQEKVEQTPSGHTMVDGPTEIKDLDKTEENKAYVKSFVENILMGKKPELLTTYFDGDNYIQHNPSIADGLSGLGAALQAMAEQGIEMKYDTIHRVIGQGNFVLVVSEGTFAGNHTSYYDLFRVENGKIAEHWDVMESILPEEQHANSNGKF